jgi:hypothetical protein
MKSDLDRSRIFCRFSDNGIFVVIICPNKNEYRIFRFHRKHTDICAVSQPAISRGLPSCLQQVRACAGAFLDEHPVSITSNENEKTGSTESQCSRAGQIPSDLKALELPHRPNPIAGGFSHVPKTAIAEIHYPDGEGINFGRRKVVIIDKTADSLRLQVRIHLIQFII